MRPLLASLAAAGFALAGCSYDFTNPAENLGAGEVAGRVVADLAGDGVLVVVPGAEVKVRNSTNVQTTRDSGRFFLTGLVPGRHTLLFAIGSDWALQRDVEVAPGADGSLEGIVLGDLRIRRAVTLTGTVTPPSGAAASPVLRASALRSPSAALGAGLVIDPFPTTRDPAGVVVDEATGQSVAATAERHPVDGFTGRFTYRFPGAPVGSHRIRFAISAEVGGVWTTWVGGPLAQSIPDASEGRSLTLVPTECRTPDPDLKGRLRFQVAVASGAPAFDVLISDAAGVTLGDGSAGNPYPVPGAGGWVDVELSEGPYTVFLDVGDVTGYAAPASLQAIVAAGQTTDLGTLSIVDNLAVNEAFYSCLYDTDCQEMYVCNAGTCTFQEPHVTTPACVTTSQVQSECFAWVMTCNQPPYTTTSCDNGKGTCQAGPGFPLCVPNGAFSCTVGAEFYYPATCGSSIPACIADVAACSGWEAVCSGGSPTFCASDTGICAAGPGGPADPVCVPNGFPSCTQAAQTWNAPMCVPTFPACITDGNTPTDCAAWQTACFSSGTFTQCGGGLGFCTGPGPYVCVPSGQTTCMEAATPWNLPATCP